MKIYKLLIITLMTVMSNVAFAQDSKTATCQIKVSGVCEMCKARIENAAYIKGVKYINWTIETGIAQIVYKPEKVNELEIQQAIAAVGHDTEKVQADSVSYLGLPQCCAYNDGVNIH